MPNMRYGTGVLLVLAAGTLWSFQGLIIRNIEEAGSWATLFWRSVGMAPVLFLWIAARSKIGLKQEFADIGVAGIIGAVGLLAAFAGAIYAFQTTTVANAVLLFAASPFFAAALGLFILQERVSASTWATMMLALVGILVMVQGGITAEGVTAQAITGNLAAVGSALGFAVFTVALRRGKRGNMTPTVVLGGVFSIIVGAVMCWMLGQKLLVRVEDIAIAISMGAVTLSGGMLLYTIGGKVVPAAQSTLLSLIEVLLAPFWVWLFFQEQVTTATLMGGAILLIAVGVHAVINNKGAT
jgi:DME family drug/metabolite transporter